MNIYREQWLKERETNDSELFEKIKNIASPDIKDLWSLSESRFIEWRKLHDFPRLLNHFDEKFLLFKEWKIENKLTNEIIISNGEITPFLENKRFSKRDKSLYLTKQTWDDNERTFVAYKKMEGEEKQFDTSYKYSLVVSFIPYLDWLKVRNKYQEILYINSRSAPRNDMERVWIHKDIYAPNSEFELLKMGGIPIPVNALGILFRGKKIEFANMCGLQFTGDIAFGEEGNLSFSYCACDNWVAEEFSMPAVELDHCSIGNFSLTNSKLQQWTFYNCITSGDFFNSKLYTVNIFGGIFNPIMQDCTLSDAHIKRAPNIA